MSGWVGPFFLSMSTPLEDSLPHFAAGKIAQCSLSSHEPGRQERDPRPCPSDPLSAVAAGEAWLPHHPHRCPVSPRDIRLLSCLRGEQRH